MPTLLFFTDPERTPDVAAAAERLPRGAAIVYRAFGAPDAERQALALKAIAQRRGLKLLIGADTRLAARVVADGVHLPERMAHQASALKRRHPCWIITAAAHSLGAARRDGPDAVVISAVFPSRSPSAGRPLGAVRLARIVRGTGRLVYALGGINEETARGLLRTGVIGVAAVDGLRT